MATFTILVKIYSIEYFCNTEVPGLGEIFVQRKFLAIPDLYTGRKGSGYMLDLYVHYAGADQGGDTT